MINQGSGKRKCKRCKKEFALHNLLNGYCNECVKEPQNGGQHAN